MHLDVSTLMVMGSFVAACAGVVLLIDWWQNRKVWALALWGLADFIIAGGILSLMVGAALHRPFWSIAGGSLLVLGPGLMWKSARVFDTKPAPLVLALLGVVVVGLASGVPSLRNVSAPLSLTIGAIYSIATATTLWFGRNDGLAARWPLIICTAVHAAVLLIGTYSIFNGTLGQDEVPAVISLFGLIHFESIIFTIISAVFIIVLVRQRNEATVTMRANVDGLTGIANRAAFMERAGRVMERCQREGTPVSVMMFDLDHFKAVNDMHGHAVGDDVIRRFCTVVAEALRPNDVFGRVGGEEFALVLPGSGIEAACVRADRIRASFAENCRFIGGNRVDATVSGGVSVSLDAGQRLNTLLEHSDKALYRAKANGRNQIQPAEQPEAKRSAPTILRVA